MRARGAIVIAVGLVACGGPAPAPAPASSAPEAPSVAARPAEVEGPIVATVDGEPIGLPEVEDAARRTGLSPLEALHRLEQERVLARRARAAGLESDPEVRSAARRAAVQALLADRVEHAVGPSDVTDAQIAALYQSSRSAFVRPERRESVHVLAALEGDARHDDAAVTAARRFIEGVIARLSASPDPAHEADAIGAEHRVGVPYTVRVEHLPASPRVGAFEAAFSDALFSQPTPGVVPTPVETSFGVHAIFVSAIQPAFDVSLEEATPILRRQLLAEQRGATLDALTASLAARTPVALDPRGVAVLEDATDLFGGAEASR